MLDGSTRTPVCLSIYPASFRFPDNFVAPTSDRNNFREYEFTVDSLKEFDGFKIKVMMTATNQAHPPKFSEFRAIALS